MNTATLRLPRLPLSPVGPASVATPFGLVALVSVVSAVCYNAGLAMANAAGVQQSFGTVAATELLILAGLGLAILAMRSVSVVPTSLIILAILTSLFVTFASQSLSLDCARSVTIICLFFMLGTRVDGPQIVRVFRVLSVCVLAVLVLEIVDTELYARIFQPSSYYANTRGIKEFSLDQSGLFRNALGYQSRFSFGLTSHRTASLFIEQVSLANFAGVLTLLLISTYDSLSRWDRILHLGTLILILLTNSSRTSSSLSLVFLVGYFVFPFLTGSWAFLVMPASLLAGLGVNLLTGGDVDSDVIGDDFTGRIAITMHHLRSFDVATAFGFDASRLPNFLDSGYAYAIASFTIVGFLLFWLVAASAIPADTSQRRRCIFGMNIYLFANMMIGGTAVFSIKVAAPLWILAGFFSTHPTLRVIRASGPVRVRPPDRATRSAKGWRP